jgi:Flp pilus assembly protein TadB
VLLWQMASLARTDPARLRPMIAAFAVATIAAGVVAWQFIIPIPAVFSAVLAACLVVAFVRAR